MFAAGMNTISWDPMSPPQLSRYTPVTTTYKKAMWLVITKIISQHWIWSSSVSSLILVQNQILQFLQIFRIKTFEFCMINWKRKWCTYKPYVTFYRNAKFWVHNFYMLWEIPCTHTYNQPICCDVNLSNEKYYQTTRLLNLYFSKYYHITQAPIVWHGWLHTAENTHQVWRTRLPLLRSSRLEHSAIWLTWHYWH